jgi:DNA-binding CsgD family transcriptional regulator
MGDLAALGLSEPQERLYELLATASSRTEEDLATALGLPVVEVAAGLVALRGLGLAYADPGDAGTYSVAPVELSLDALARARRQELDRAQSFGRDLAARAARSGSVHRPEQLVSVVVGHDAIGSLAMQLQRSATDEVLYLDRPPYYAPYSHEGTGINPEQEASLGQGVRYRTVYDASLLDDAAIIARLRREVSLGEEGRVLAELPLKLLVVDRTMAVVPLIADEEQGPPAALLVRPSVLVDSLVALFEALWKAATPLPLPAEELAGDEEQDLRTVTGLLAAGMSDARIARTMGISERTVRRKVALLLERLGVETRFQAALRARESGWV